MQNIKDLLTGNLLSRNAGDMQFRRMAENQEVGDFGAVTGLQGALASRLKMFGF